MTPLTETLALIAALGIAAQWLGWRLKIPTIVLLVAFGILIGPVLGIIRPSEALGPAFPSLISLGVAVILFEGGLSLRWHELKQTATGVKRLVTLGVVLSLGLGALAAHWIGALSWPVALVFAAIAVVTGPTVILPLLRQARLRRRPASFLKWEGIVNDPTGALLAVLLFEYFVSPGAPDLGHTFAELALGLLSAGLLGGVGGWLLGRAYLAGKVPEYLKGPVALGAALAAFGLANLVMEEAGLVAATALGVVLGNMGLPSIEEVRRFKESVAMLLVAGLFLLLTADLDPDILLALDWHSALLILAMLFLVRPLTIWLATIGAGMSWQERLLIGWIAPRGIVAAAVAGVLGPGLAARGYADGDLLLPLIFTLILTTVLLHGFSLSWLARKLDLSASPRQGLLISGANPWSTGLAQALHSYKVPVLMTDRAWHRLRRARHAGLPVYFGELLSEHAESELELSDYGTLLAISSNDAYNSLVCAQYTPAFDRRHVYQLAAEPSHASRKPGSGTRGRTFIDGEIQYEDLQRGWYRGWTFQATSITKEFGVSQLLEVLPEGALPVLIISKDAGVRLLAADEEIKAEPGQRLLWFGTKQERLKTNEDSPETQEGEPERLPDTSQ
ncbi:cation:proton antiporter [Thiorhodococcus minor]|uniref:Sodium:proton antiporter n=1 Tax=Thiorhodococcus minor TaxID=57489 RepID=A0A6M0K1Y7_9GAMM|nr:cation:proton antiporter [Thiorhodococcus minor]NEV63740.1 sodium:proton antiporter [Thiorhodococcus minor]